LIEQLAIGLPNTTLLQKMFWQPTSSTNRPKK
jgi:hypothetical protein